MRSSLAAVLGVVVTTGCYSLRPVSTAAVAQGADVAFDVTDAGRMDLEERVGSDILQLEGRLISKENGKYLLSVKTIRFLRGGEQVWSGERVSIVTDHVRNVYERRFSPGRTAAFAAATAGGVAVFFATRSLLGLGSEPGDNGRPDEPGTSLTRPPVGTRP